MPARNRSGLKREGKRRLGDAKRRSAAVRDARKKAVGSSLTRLVQTLPPTDEEFPDIVDRPPEPVDL